MEKVLSKGFSAEEIKKYANAVVNLITNHLERSDDNKTIDWKSPEEQLEFWKNDMASPTPADPIVLFKSIIEKSLNLHSPKYMGHQVAVTLPITVLSSAIIAYLNQGMPVYEMGMVGNALERIIIKQLAEKFGFGLEASGIITSGGSLANLTALLSARTRFEVKDFHNLVIIVSGEAHYSIERAAGIMGLGAGSIIKVPVNEKYQMQTELLDDICQRVTAEGKKVLCVVGCACSTAVGAYDDLKGIGEWAQKKNIWFHVDGAHGAAVVYSQRYKELINGIEKADSVTLDFHKLLMAPSLTTAVVYKEGRFADRTFAQKADYLFTEKEGDDWYNSGKRTVECTKPMYILNVYTILRVYGEEIFEQNINKLYGLSREFAQMIRDDEMFELAVEPQSNIVCFRCKDSDDPDSLNRKIADELLRDGEFFIVNTVIKGTFWLRVTIQNPMTDASHLQRLLDHILKVKEHLSVEHFS